MLRALSTPFSVVYALPRRAPSPLAAFALPRCRRVWTPSPPPGSVPSSSAGDHEAALAFVEARGWTPEVARGVVDQLSSPEWDGASPLALATRMAGAWEIGEDAGLSALAAAVQREQAARSGKARVRFEVRPARGGEPFACEGFEGMTLRDVAERGEGAGAAALADCLECACSGVMACSTCHVYVDAAWLEAVGAPSEAEEDMLDLAFEPGGRSRLGCQLVLRPALEGLRVELPAGSHNLFDAAGLSARSW